jgi:hypothetical protein
MLKHERALQIPAAVQTRREPEVTVEQCPRAAKQGEKLLAIH